MQQLSLHLAENLAWLDARFGASADYYAKEIMIYHCRGCIVLFDGMASLDSLWDLLLDAASRQAPQTGPGTGVTMGGARGQSPTREAELILHGCPKKGGKASARKPIPAIKTVAQADDRGVRKSAGGLRVCRPGGCWQRAGPPTGRTRK